LTDFEDDVNSFGSIEGWSEVSGVLPYIRSGDRGVSGALRMLLPPTSLARSLILLLLLLLLLLRSGASSASCCRSAPLLGSPRCT
jgi:hypothetical protein